MPLGTTDIGFINKNNQWVMKETDLASNHDNQKIYWMECGECQSNYGANGCDIHIRKCPNCQGGVNNSEVK